MSIDPLLSITTQNRKAFKKILDSFNLEQLNEIPSGFNNNIVWNVAHVISIQQFITYGLTNTPYFVNEDFVSSFTRGTKPSMYYDNVFIESLKTLLFTSLDDLHYRCQHSPDMVFHPFMTAIKFEITDLMSALAFNQYHEAIHMGAVMNMRKFL